MSHVPNIAEPDEPLSPDDILIGLIQSGHFRDKRFLINTEDLARHTAVFGSTGSGKTVVLKVLAESALAKHIPVLALDVQGDLAGLLVPAPGPETYRELGLPEPVGVQDDNWAMAAAVAERMRQVVHGRYLTPYDNIGERLAISPLPQCPKNLQVLEEEEPDLLMGMASSAAYALMVRCGMTPPRDGVGGHAELVRGGITATILDCWRAGTTLDGVEGINAFAEAVRKQRESMLPDKDRDKLLVGLKSLSIDPAARWLLGKRLDWDELLSAPAGKTPLVVIGLNHLPPETIPWVVSQVLNSAYDWCSRGAPNPGRPRLLTVVDELAGEGGRQSLLPPLTFSSSSGLALRKILRKGRHYGMCLAAGTQAPRDVDSKNAPNFNNRFVGKLPDKYDARIALNGANLNPERLAQVIHLVSTTQTSCMTAIRANGSYEFLKIRWLGTVHCRMPKDTFASLYEQGIIKRGEKVDREILTVGATGLETSDRRAAALLVPFWKGDDLAGVGLAVPGPDAPRVWSWQGDPQAIWSNLLARLASVAMDRGLRFVVPTPETTLVRLARAAEARHLPWPGLSLGAFVLPPTLDLPSAPGQGAMTALAQSVLQAATTTGLERYRPPRIGAGTTMPPRATAPPATPHAA